VRNCLSQPEITERQADMNNSKYLGEINYVIGLIHQEHKTAEKLHKTHELLVNIGDVNLLGDNTDVIQRTETLTDASKDVAEHRTASLYDESKELI
jgi:hypothetical protein